MGLRRFVVRVVLPTVGLCALVFFSAVPVSCQISEQGIALWERDLTAPVIASWRVTGSDSLEVVFSEAVTMTGAVICSAENSSDAPAAADETYVPSLVQMATRTDTIPAQIDEHNERIVITSAVPLETGANYRVYGETADACGNTLTFSLPFIGYNDHPPELVIVAVHPQYATGQRKGQKVYRNEFVGLYAVTGGNLAGIQIESAHDGAEQSFLLPAVDVRQGMFITVHLRTKGDDCISETPDELAAARQEYASDTALDFWSENEKARLGDDTDVIAIRNSLTGALVDVFAYAPQGLESWQKESFQAVMNEAMAAGLVAETSPTAAVPSDGLTPSKMFARTDGAAIAAGRARELAAAQWTIVPVIERNGTKNLGRFLK
ncbi:MAG: hypothetical protein IJ191_00645 [Treponema sp.]|nr:hypothetical protein [Treponema sp.]